MFKHAAEGQLDFFAASPDQRGASMEGVGLRRRVAMLLGSALLAAQWIGAPGVRADAAADGEALRVAMLAAHNRERATLGLPPLVWSEALAAEAAANAALLAAARDPILAHLQINNGKPRGENLWLGTQGAFSFADMAQGWLDERSLYVNGLMPDISSSGNWADVGHYSQMIWRTTREIGCGLASNRENDILVCRYDPPGNVYGRNAISGERR